MGEDKYLSNHFVLGMDRLQCSTIDVRLIIIHQKEDFIVSQEVR